MAIGVVSELWGALLCLLHTDTVPHVQYLPLSYILDHYGLMDAESRGLDRRVS